jgi:hypothetical protein
MDTQRVKDKIKGGSGPNAMLLVVEQRKSEARRNSQLDAERRRHDLGMVITKIRYQQEGNHMSAPSAAQRTVHRKSKIHQKEVKKRREFQ